MNTMKTLWRPAALSFVLLALATGLVYPLALTGLAQLVMPERANGSLVVRDGKVIGSRLIGQAFDDPRYFWGRPSATAPMPYNAAGSSGSNLAPSNPALVETVRARIDALRAANPDAPGPVPMELVTASASGLDPHISPEAARWQIPRIARVRGLSAATVEDLVRAHTETPWLGLIGMPRVNVLQINLALDALATGRTAPAR
ncbi:potassium-transporting ATPase subunit KdpC [Thermomonas sp.]|jgi:K+-transporting ATPase ATPase C chain|uniref:potassium-transporting ATPase subunit KdpC n=1 Tax=Thermomonas sp. TaxID=1971895 RepID=UPI0031F313A2